MPPLEAEFPNHITHRIRVPVESLQGWIEAQEQRDSATGSAATDKVQCVRYTFTLYQQMTHIYASWVFSLLP